MIKHDTPNLSRLLDSKEQSIAVVTVNPRRDPFYVGIKEWRGWYVGNESMEFYFASREAAVTWLMEQAAVEAAEKGAEA